MAAKIEKTLSDGTLRYIARLRDGGVNRSVTFADLRERDRFATLVEATGNRMPADAVLRATGFAYLLAAQHPATAAAAPIALVDYARQFLDTLDVHRQTRIKYGRYVENYLQPFFESVDIRMVDRAMMRGWQRFMTDELHLSGKTVRNVRGTVLVPMFAAATVRGDHGEPALLDYSPMHGLKPPRSEPYDRELLTDARHARILFAAAYEVEADAAELLYVLAHFGNRWGEAAAIYDDACFLGAAKPYVLVKRKAVYVSGEGWITEAGAKTPAGAYRKLHVDERVGAILARRCASRRGLLFPGPSGGLWAHGNFYRDRWQPIVARARELGLPHHLTMHGLRKSTLTALFEGGVDPVTVAATAGHEDPGFTLRRYTSPTGRGSDVLLAALGAFYPPPGEAAA